MFGLHAALIGAVYSAALSKEQKQASPAHEDKQTNKEESTYGKSYYASSWYLPSLPAIPVQNLMNQQYISSTIDNALNMDSQCGQSY